MSVQTMGGSSDSNAILDVKIGHVLGARPTLAHLRKLRKLLGSYASEIEEFYSVHNGCELYVQSPENIGLLFYPIADWDNRGDGVRELFH